MKKTLLSICLFGLFVSLTAQDQGFYNSLSPNFAGATPNLGDGFPLQPAENLWVPGLEYRFFHSRSFRLVGVFEAANQSRHDTSVLRSSNKKRITPKPVAPPKIPSTNKKSSKLKPSLLYSWRYG